MKTVKKSVFAIGVALSVAPIFSSVFAQSAHNSATVLSELHAMRTEIAELRDMVERQQFELKKIKQNIAKAQAEKPSLLPQTAQSEVQTVVAATDVGPQSGSGLVSPQSYSEITQNTDGQALVGDFQQSEGYSAVQVSDTELQSAANSESASSTGFYNGISNTQDAEVVERSIDPSDEIQKASDMSVDSMVKPSVASIDSTSSVTDSAGSVLPLDPTVNQGAINPRVGSPILAVPSSPPIPISKSGAINAGLIPEAPTTSVVPVASVQAEKASIDPQVALEPPAGQSAAVQFTEDQYYDRGFDFLKKSKYDEAISVFNEQTAQYPQGELADDAHYWIAEALFINRKPLEAKPHLRAIIDNYPQSARLPDAMLKTAYIEQDLGNLIEARILLQEIVARYGSSNAAIAARNRLENLKRGN